MIEFEPKDGVRFIKNVMIPMDDGVQLAVDMHVPDDGGGDWRQTPRPLLMEYMPYRKDDIAPYTGYHHYFAQHGIIGAQLDCRGTGSSEGVNFDEYTEREQRDGEGERREGGVAFHGQDMYVADTPPSTVSVWPLT